MTGQFDDTLVAGHPSGWLSRGSRRRNSSRRQPVGLQGGPAVRRPPRSRRSALPGTRRQSAPPGRPAALGKPPLVFPRRLPLLPGPARPLRQLQQGMVVVARRPEAARPPPGGTKQAVEQPAQGFVYVVTGPLQAEERLPALDDLGVMAPASARLEQAVNHHSRKRAPITAAAHFSAVNSALPSPPDSASRGSRETRRAAAGHPSDLPDSRRPGRWTASSPR